VSSQGIRRAEVYVRQAVDAGVIPLADVAPVRRDTLVWRESFVNPELAARGPRLDATSRYCLGSFTTVFVATPGATGRSGRRGAAVPAAPDPVCLSCAYLSRATVSRPLRGVRFP
jgi:hypothetical protein